MPGVVTTCAKCGAGFNWNTDFMDSMPDCPKCGYNPNQKYRASGVDGLVKMLRSGSREDKNHAAAELGNRGDRAGVEPLIAALNDREPIVVLPSAIALGKIGDPRAVGPLIQVMKRGRQYGPSGSAALSLAQLGTPEAIQAVSANLGELDQKKIHEVICALIDQGKKSVQALVGALESKDALIRKEAAWALGKIGDKSALDSIVPLMKDSNQSVRRYASEACSELGWMVSDKDELFAFLLQGNQWDKLREMGPDAITRLEEQLTSGPTWPDRELAASGLDKMSWEPSAEQRITCALAKGKFEDFSTDAPGAMEAALQALIDPSYSHRFDILKLLKSRADKTCVPALIAVVAMDQGTTSYIAAEILGYLKDTRAVEPLIAALSAKEDLLVAKAAEALGLVGDTRAVEPLLAFLNSGHRSQHCAAKALGALGDTRAVEPLIKALHSKEKNMSYCAIEPLGKLGDTRAVKPLKRIYKDARRDTFDRQKAADALQQITGKKPEEEPKQGCFIATACYGSPVCAEVLLLREFRDRHLARSALGRAAVRAYYRLSPSIAAALSRSPSLRTLVRRAVVAPAVRLVTRRKERMARMGSPR